MLALGQEHILTVSQQGPLLAGTLTRNWRQVTDNDDISLIANIVGVKILLFGKTFGTSRFHGGIRREEDKDPVIDEAVKVVSTQAVLVSLINSLQELSKLKAVQEMQQEDKVFLSRVFTVPRTKRGKEYGRHFILKLKVSLLHTF